MDSANYVSKEEEYGNELAEAEAVSEIEPTEKMDLETTVILTEDKVDTGG